MAKKEHILSSAQQLFQASGFVVTTMEDIAAQAGMGKSSLYYYFKSKEEIFHAVLDKEIDEIIAETMVRVNGVALFRDKITAFALVKFELLKKRKELYKLMEAGMDAETLSKYNAVKIAAHKKYIYLECALLQEVFVAAMVNGEIAQLNDASLEQTLFIFIASLRGINREITLHSPDQDAVRLLSLYCDTFFAGLQ